MFRSVLFLLLPLSAAFGSPREDLKQRALEGVEADQRPALTFLIDHMPERDLATVPVEYLRNNVALACKARAEFPWGKEIPDEIFFNDVVPYASLDEARDDWRAGFLERFRKQVAGARDAREALTRLNATIAKETGVEYNTRRRAPNQGPLESIQRKMASCSGLSILLTDALRSVGIPARIAGTALWTTKEGNHNWVEVWLPDTRQWQFTEYYPDKAGLDHGWLLADAARALPGSTLHGIYATSWKTTGHHFPLIWDLDDTAIPAEEVTKRYVDLGAKTLPAPEECELRIEALADGKRIARPVTVLQGDVTIATGTTPAATDDLNRFFSVKVKRGERYQITGPDPAGEPRNIAIGKDESMKKITL